MNNSRMPPDRHLFQPHRPWQAQVRFYVGNALLISTLGLVGVIVGSAGLKALIPYMGVKIYRFSLLGWTRDIAYVGDLNLAEVLIVGLLVVGLVAWKEILRTVKHWKSQPLSDPFFILITAVWVIVVASDASIFFCGLRSTNTALWSGSDTSVFVALVATVLYTTIYAAIGAWHLNYFSKGE